MSSRQMPCQTLANVAAIPSQDRYTPHADWAGCKAPRKSTTGEVTTVGKHTVNKWSEIQAFVVLGSGESELNATLRASAETFGPMATCKDFGVVMVGAICGDARTVIGIINRNGVGKTKRIDAGLLWTQQITAQQWLKVDKAIGGNPVDMHAKYLDWFSIGTHTTRLNCEFVSGRTAETSQQHQGQSRDDEYALIGDDRPWPSFDTMLVSHHAIQVRTRKGRMEEQI